MHHETKRDEQLQQLKKSILEEFPDQQSEVSSSIQEYWNIRNELSYTDGLIMKEAKLIVPKSLRREMLQKSQTGHMGIEKCRQRARQVMYWPGMNQSIE